MNVFKGDEMALQVARTAITRHLCFVVTRALFVVQQLVSLDLLSIVYVDAVPEKLRAGVLPVS
jgi:hypothetical protein